MTHFWNGCQPRLTSCPVSTSVVKRWEEGKQCRRVGVPPDCSVHLGGQVQFHPNWDELGAFHPKNFHPKTTFIPKPLSSKTTFIPTPNTQHPTTNDQRPTTNDQHPMTTPTRTALPQDRPSPGPPFPRTTLPQDRPPPDRPPPDKFRSFFSLSRRKIRSFLPSLGVFSWNFGGVFEDRDPQMCTFGALGLSCETPAAPPDRAAENSKRAHLSAPALQTPPKFHEKTSQREKKRTNFPAGEGKKSAIFWAPHPSGLHPSRPHFFHPLGPHPSNPHHLGCPHPSGPTLFTRPSGPHPSGPTLPKVVSNEIGFGMKLVFG